MGSKIWWHEAHVGLTRCASSACRIVGGFVLPVLSAVRSTNAGTSGGGSGGLTPRNVCRNHLPRVTGEVRAAFDVTVISAPLPSRPRRTSSDAGSVTRRKCGP